ncbi:MAG: SPOR domain-containing protein [Spirochaetales bacterium]|nr:SPOR domain-containing protein [Spirochaetales bacterium]
MSRNLNKITVVIFCLLFFCSLVYPEESTSLIIAGSTPEKAVERLLSSDGLSDEEYRSNLITAAEIKQLTGELTLAADLFKQASLAVKGNKDFTSLYRAALIRVETADYRTAEADLRAISTFSDDLSLRIRANVLSSRIKSYQNSTAEALDIISGILINNIELPMEAYLWSIELAESALEGPEYENFIRLYEEKKISEREAYSLENRIPGPDSVFGLITTPDIESQTDKTAAAPRPISEPDQSEITAVVIQIGSFLRMENAEDLKKTVALQGFAADIRIKSVNGSDYNVVVIPVGENDTQSLIIKLKEKGFEGYPLY